jgi:hypothetical protein
MVAFRQTTRIVVVAQFEIANRCGVIPKPPHIHQRGEESHTRRAVGNEITSPFGSVQALRSA